MILNTARRKPGKSIRERVGEQLEANRAARQAACDHVWRRDFSSTAARWCCARCGACRSY